VSANVYSSFADLVGIAAQLVGWRAAVLQAELDGDRHLRAAKAKAILWIAEYGSATEVPDLLGIALRVNEVTDIVHVGNFCAGLAAIPLPIGYYAEEHRLTLRQSPNDDRQPPPPDLEIAFLLFRINGEAAAEVHFVAPGVLHDLEVEVRISRWADGADLLQLKPVTIEPSSSYELPVFEFPRPSDKPPYIMRKTGRALLKYAQHIGARPYEFKYAAWFSPNASEQALAVVGQRTLRLEGIDVTNSPVTGYVHVDSKLLEIRDRLRRYHRQSQDELASVMEVLQPIASLAARSLQDAIFDSSVSEGTFQKALRDELRKAPRIGSKLEEHPRSGAGVMDLSFQGIPIELKYEADRLLTLEDCERFAQQTQSYVVANGKRVGILCVLDNSKKVTPPFPAEDGIRLLSLNDGGSPVHVVVVLIQGNLSRPSDLSRRSASSTGR